MASLLKVDKLDPQSGTALELGTSGDTISIPSGATLNISASTLTPPATMPASSGINFTALNATNLGSGTVPTARLGTGSASSSVFLAGDNTWIAAGGAGKILQVAYTVDTGPSTASDNSNNWVTTGVSVDITPSATSSKIFLTWNHIFYDSGASNDEVRMTFFRDGSQLNVNIMSQVGDMWIPSVMSYVDEPSSTSAITYAAYFRSNQGNTVYGANSSYTATITAWEIDGS